MIFLGMERSQGLLNLICVLCLMLVMQPARSAEIGLAVDKIGKREQKFHTHLQKLLPKHSLNLVDKKNLKQSFDAWVIISDPVLSEFAKIHTKHDRVLVLFTKLEHFNAIQKQSPNLALSFLDNVPTIERQLALVKALKPQVGPVGVFYSDATQGVVQQAEAAAVKLGMQVLTAPLHDPLDWDRTAMRVLKQADMILGVEDEQIYNATNIRSILMRLYRASRPLVGPDKAFVKAGAVASIYSGMGETLKATADLLNSNQTWPKLIENKYFKVSINRQVARSLQISIDDEDNLQKKVEGGLQ